MMNIYYALGNFVRYLSKYLLYNHFREYYHYITLITDMQYENNLLPLSLTLSLSCSLKFIIKLYFNSSDLCGIFLKVNSRHLIYNFQCSILPARKFTIEFFCVLLWIFFCREYEWIMDALYIENILTSFT